MQGNDEIIASLNKLLASEFAAIHQYSAHRATVENWGYKRLVGYLDERIEDERKHAKALLDRIAWLGGKAEVDKLAPITVADEVDAMARADREAEKTAILAYNKAIELACAKGDDGTRAVLEANLTDEEDHIRDLDAELKQIEQQTLGNFLSANMG